MPSYFDNPFSWYAANYGGNQQSSQISPNMMLGGGNVGYAIPNWPAFGPQNAARLAGVDTGPFAQIMGQVGQLFGQDWQATNRFYDPMARQMMFQQQREQSALLDQFADIDREQYTDMYSRLYSKMLMGSPADTRKYAETTADATLNVLNNPQMMALMSNPAIRDIVNTLNPMGGTAGQAAGALYQATRGVGLSTDQVAGMTEQIAQGYTKNGQIDRQFTYGLRYPEIAEVAGTMIQQGAMDHRLAETDPAQFKQAIKKANELAAGLKELFGSDTPITKLFENLQQMTQGSLGQVSADELRSMVDRVKGVALKTGLSVDLVQNMAGVGAVRATQMGLPGIVGTRAGLEAASYGSAVSSTGFGGPVWGKMGQNQMMALSANEQMTWINSVEGTAFLGMKRMVESGILDDPAARAFVERVEGQGSMSEADMKMLGDTDRLFDRFAGGFGSGDDETRRRSFSAQLGNRFANSRFYEAGGRGGEAFSRAGHLKALRETLNASDTLRMLGDPDKLSSAIMREVFESTEIAGGTGGSPEDVKGRVKRAIEGVTGREATESEVETQYQAYLQAAEQTHANPEMAHQRFMRTNMNARTSYMEAVERMTDMTPVMRRLGMGSQPWLGNRIAGLLGSDQKLTGRQMMGAILGVPGSQLEDVLKRHDVGGEDLTNLINMADEIQTTKQSLYTSIKDGDTVMAAEHEKNLQGLLERFGDSALGGGVAEAAMRKESTKLFGRMGGLAYSMERSDDPGAARAMQSQLLGIAGILTPDFRAAQADKIRDRLGLKDDEAGNKKLAEWGMQLESDLAEAAKHLGAGDVDSAKPFLQRLVEKGQTLSPRFLVEGGKIVKPGDAGGFEVEAVDSSMARDVKANMLKADAMEVTGDIIVRGRIKDEGAKSPSQDNDAKPGDHEGDQT